jgi:hypothetical protein
MFLFRINPESEDPWTFGKTSAHGKAFPTQHSIYTSSRIRKRDDRVPAVQILHSAHGRRLKLDVNYACTSKKDGNKLGLLYKP